MVTRAGPPRGAEKAKMMTRATADVVGRLAGEDSTLGFRVRDARRYPNNPQYMMGGDLERHLVDRLRAKEPHRQGAVRYFGNTWDGPMSPP